LSVRKSNATRIDGIYSGFSRITAGMDLDTVVGIGSTNYVVGKFVDLTPMRPNPSGDLE
jgi:hypothetical protein